MSEPLSNTLDETAATSPGTQELRRPPFDILTITLHWATVLLVLAQLGSGLLYGQVEERPWATYLLGAHQSLGMAIWIVTVLRLLWRLTGASFPPFPVSMTLIQRAAARLSEYALYALLLIQPATGLAQTLLRGEHPGYARLFHGAHELGARCLIGLVSLHAAAALFHHFVRRDDVLEAMAPVLRRRVRRNSTDGENRRSALATSERD